MNKKILGLWALVALGTLLIYADTTTTRMGLTKPDVGSVNWGPKLNTNFDIIDATSPVLAQANTFGSTQTFQTIWIGTTTSPYHFVFFKSTTAIFFTDDGRIGIGGLPDTQNTNEFIHVESSVSTSGAAAVEISAYNLGNQSARLQVLSGGGNTARAIYLFGAGTASPSTFWSGGPIVANSIGIQEDQNGSYSPSNPTFLILSESAKNWWRSASSTAQWYFTRNTTNIFSIDQSSTTSDQQTFLKGSATNDLARAGDYGEYISASSAATLSAAGSGAFLSYTQLTLTAGNWSCTGSIGMQPNGGTVTVEEVAISTSPNSSTDHTFAKNLFDETRTFETGSYHIITVPDVPYEITASQTLYLKGMFTYSAGTPRMNSSYFICRRPR